MTPPPAGATWPTSSADQSESGVETIGTIIGALIGYKLGDRYLAPSGETPVQIWAPNADLSKPTVSLTKVRYHGKTFYKVYAIANGNSHCWEKHKLHLLPDGICRAR